MASLITFAVIGLLICNLAMLITSTVILIAEFKITRKDKDAEKEKDTVQRKTKKTTEQYRRK